MTANGLEVLKNRYLRRKLTGELESPYELFRRVAKCVADAEINFSTPESDIQSLAEQFFEVMRQGMFLPNSPALMNGGFKDGMLSACFVLPVNDSIDSIFDAIKHTALIQKAGGGPGFDFSQLRPKGDLVASSGGHTSGPLAFLRVFSEATNAIQQGAFRRGANMGIMRVDHPDILNFIRVKKDLGLLTNFNLSVGVTSSFMRLLNEEPDFIHQVRNPRTGKVYALKHEKQSISVSSLFGQMVDLAWENGEPGLIFLDQINLANPTAHLGDMSATNACGEQPLMPYESCNLGSINLSHPRLIQMKGTSPRFNWKCLGELTGLAVRFLDNIIEANEYPFPELTDAALGNRKIGLGVMGFADLLYKLGIPYDSEEALHFGGSLMRSIQLTSHEASRQLALKRGVFRNWKGSIWEKRGLPMRNACTTCVAPTGSISIIAGCSGGIEPNFALSFQRNIMEGQPLLEINGVFEQTARTEDFYSEKLMKEIALRKGSIQGLGSITPDIERIFVTSHDIAPKWHVRMQAAFQEYCDAAVSKTVNLPHDASPTHVKEIFLQAHLLGCKGVTVYRDGCRLDQPMAAMENNATVKTDKPDSRDRSAFQMSCVCGAQWTAEQSCGKCPTCGQSVCGLA